MQNLASAYETLKEITYFYTVLGIILSRLEGIERYVGDSWAKLMRTENRKNGAILSEPLLLQVSQAVIDYDVVMTSLA